MKLQKQTINLRFISLCLFVLAVMPLQAQKKGTVIEQIVAMVGDEVILQSELQYEINRAKAENQVAVDGNIHSQVIENMLMSKLLKEQAIVDSVIVTEDEVERQLDQRMSQYLRYAGSEEKLEQYFKKSTAEIRNELRDATRDMLIVERMKEEIVKDVKVTPAEVRTNFKEIPQDTLPLMPEKLIIQQITKKPEISEEEKDRIQEKLRNLRDEIYGGASFATMAVLHSEDPGSANKGGELGYTSRTGWVKEFADEAFSLKPGKISKIVQSDYGFHIIQLIDKKGDKVNARHILLKPKIELEYKQKAKNLLDSIRTAILNGETTFEAAAFNYSDDKDTRNNSGVLMNNRTMGAYFQKPELPPIISRNLEGVKEGELSEIFYDDQERVPMYKFFKIKSRIPEHKANLDEDWEIFENMVLTKKKQEVLNDWVAEKIKDTHVEISKNISREGFQHDWDSN
ncbi:periplasmic chaperone for outer membrane proteins SurA [Balneicella halophila]|uniref:Periplasmic chaperone for outer membrane proteins SurA n=2 Tax=Balneicella halophila TaxID=1537566 RepID=A0A7L4UNQ2_BALHA|nr:periplasmic chaperone for outer membrane proteins SurA [Balneicella halophila]